MTKIVVFPTLFSFAFGFEFTVMQFTQQARDFAVFPIMKGADHSLHLAGIKPQPMSLRTAIQFDRFIGCHRDGAESPHAARAAPIDTRPGGRALDGFADLPGLGAGQLGDPGQFAGIEPATAAFDATVDLDALKFNDDHWLAALWTHRRTFHP
ncbi:MAG: hypothetical protein O7D91_09985 [Planctomycetota bacterium]|nr:hypothetical protein [Planctomycetota bacterium]